MCVTSLWIAVLGKYINSPGFDVTIQVQTLIAEKIRQDLRAEFHRLYERLNPMKMCQ